MSGFRTVSCAIAALLITACGGGGAGGGAGGAAPPPPPPPPPPSSNLTVQVGVTGLHSSEQLELSLNGSNTSQIMGEGSVVFPLQLATGATYTVAITSAPSTTDCKLSNPTGTIANQNVTVRITCVDAPFDIRRVADVNAVSINNGSKPFGFVAFGGRVAFSIFRFEFPGFMGAGLTQLFLTDSTPGTSVPVTDESSQTVTAVAELNGKLLFNRFTQTPIIGGWSSGPPELWATQGVAGDQRKIAAADMRGVFARLGDRIVFVGGDFGQGLWTTDGTAAGSSRVTLPASVYPASFGSRADGVHRLGSVAVFAANDPTGTRLWQTDGTSAGTRQISRDSLRVLNVLGVVGNRLYFIGTQTDFHDTQLWATDGSVAGEVLVFDFSPGADEISCFTAVGSGYYLAAQNQSTTNSAVWASTNGVTIAKVLDNQYAPCGFTSFAGRTYFSVNSGLNSFLWSSNGSAAGTNAVALGSLTLPEYATSRGFVLNGKMILPASTAATGLELWSTSDGATFELFEDIAPGPASGLDVNWFFAAVIANRAYFSASDGLTGQEPWVTNGTAAGTVQLDNLRPETDTPDGVQEILGYNSRGVFFRGCTESTGCELYISDGTEEGTQQIMDSPIGNGSTPGYAGVAGDLLVFTNTLGGLWSSDGTAAGTQQIAPISIYRSHARQGELLFVDNEAPRRLWRTDGTSAGTVRLATDFFEADGFTEFNGFTYFTAESNSHVRGLYRTNGLVAGTEYVVQAPYARPGMAAAATGALVFAGGDSQHGEELWTTDTTVAGTHLLRDSYPGAESGYTLNLTSFRGNVFFTGRESETAWGLFGTDGSSVWLVAPLINSGPTEILAMPDALYFTNDRAVWKTDGTANGTTTLVGPRPGQTARDPYALTRALDGVFFAAYDGVGSGRPFVIVNNVALRASAGVGASYVPLFVPSGPFAGTYFIGDDGHTGAELWKLGAMSVP